MRGKKIHTYVKKISIDNDHTYGIASTKKYSNYCARLATRARDTGVTIDGIKTNIDNLVACDYFISDKKILAKYVGSEIDRDFFKKSPDGVIKAFASLIALQKVGGLGIDHKRANLRLIKINHLDFICRIDTAFDLWLLKNISGDAPEWFKADGMDCEIPLFDENATSLDTFITSIIDAKHPYSDIQITSSYRFYIIVLYAAY